MVRTIVKRFNDADRHRKDSKKYQSTFLAKGKFGEVHVVGDKLYISKVVPSQLAIQLHDHKHAAARELYSLQCCEELLERWETPNLPMIISYKYHDSYFLKSAFNHISVPRPPALVIKQEWLGQTFAQYLEARYRAGTIDPDEWDGYFFQMMSGIGTMQERFNILHRDLHWNNVMVMRYPDPMIEYRIGYNRFFVPTYGVLLIINDWGSSHKIEVENQIGTDIGSFTDLSDGTKTHLQRSDTTSVLKQMVRDYSKIFQVKRFYNAYKFSGEPPKKASTWYNELKLSIKTGIGLLPCKIWIQERMLVHTSNMIGKEIPDSYCKDADMRTIGHIFYLVRWQGKACAVQDVKGMQVLILVSKKTGKRIWVPFEELKAVRSNYIPKYDSDVFCWM